MSRKGAAGIRCAETVRTLEGDPFALTSLFVGTSLCAVGVACSSETSFSGDSASGLSPPAEMAVEAVRSPSGRGVR